VRARPLRERVRETRRVAAFRETQRARKRLRGKAILLYKILVHTGTRGERTAPHSRARAVHHDSQNAATYRRARDEKQLMLAESTLSINVS